MKNFFGAEGLALTPNSDLNLRGLTGTEQSSICIPQERGGLHHL